MSAAVGDAADVADVGSEPFNHLYIEDFLNPEDFTQIIGAPQIRIPLASDDAEMFNLLDSAGYQILEFGGCVVDKDQYLDWHKERGISRLTC